MIRLMISVISTDEARQALQGGAEILDIKNPAEGSLGAQAPGLIREISKLFSAETEISAAIGDMPNLPGTAALAALGAASCGADYVKVGLYGTHSETDAVALLREVQRAVQEFHTMVIAALYADYRRAGTLNPECLPHIAAEAGVHGCLLDTAIKDGRALFDFLNPHALRPLAQQAHAAGLSFGLAGALRGQDLSLANDLGADVVGLRTAACRNNQRNGPLEAALVKKLHTEISESFKKTPRIPRNSTSHIL
jgi:(5-formylfuran-3-yl)methyl phosphate synthase